MSKKPSTMTVTEAGRLGGRASAAARTPEERRSLPARGYLGGVVGVVCDRVGELTPDQVARLYVALAGTSGEANRL